MSDERAVEVAQLSQPTRADVSQVSAGYYEPHQLTELANHGRLYLLADGVSGTSSGPVVSRYAIKKILHSFYTADNPEVKVRLLETIQQANADIFEQNQQNPERRVMATTLMAALFHGNKLLIASVGDSRVYVAWGQDIEHIQPEAKPAADEDSPASPRLLTAEVEPLKEVEPEKTEPTPPRRRMPQGLGLDQYVKIETFSRRLFAGDTVILGSGGLTGYITEKEIARAISRHPLEQAVQRLLALAGERGNRDHVAMSITRVLSSPVALRPPKPMTPPPAPKWSDWDNQPQPAADRSPTKPDIPAPAKLDPAAQAKQRLAQVQLHSTERQIWRRWQPYAWAVFGLAFLCVVLLLVGRFVFPTELMAAVSFLRGEETLFAEETEPAIVIPATADEIDTENTPATEPTATPDVSASPQGEATLIAESVSPLPTPETTFNSPVITPTANLASQEDTLPTATLSPSPTPQPTPATPSPTPLPTIEVPPDCTNKARFRQDVTVPDGEQFAPAETFEKVWLLQNAGTCPWGPGYTVRFVSGDTMGVNSVAPILDVTAPDSNGEISVSMIAPAAAGRYRGNWQLHDLNGEPFGPEIYLEIEVVAPDPEEVDQTGLTTLFDFIKEAGTATWSSGETSYSVLETDINESLELPASQGLVAVGPALLRGNVESDGNVLLTYPDRTAGFIEGVYTVDTPLQPTDALAATLGFIKLSILSDDGVTFEVVFTPTNGSEQVILSRNVQYGDSPITEIQPLVNIAPGQKGTFTLRVLGGESLSRDWAVWIDLRLIRLPAE